MDWSMVLGLSAIVSGFYCRQKTLLTGSGGLFHQLQIPGRYTLFADSQHAYHLAEVLPSGVDGRVTDKRVPVSKLEWHRSELAMGFHA